MAKRKDDGIPRLYVRKGATLREIYAAYKKQFTAADLQQYTEPLVGIPVEQVIARMEAIQQREESKRRKKT